MVKCWKAFTTQKNQYSSHVPHTSWTEWLITYEHCLLTDLRSFFYFRLNKKNDTEKWANVFYSNCFCLLSMVVSQIWHSSSLATQDEQAPCPQGLKIRRLSDVHEFLQIEQSYVSIGSWVTVVCWKFKGVPMSRKNTQIALKASDTTNFGS